MFCKNTLKVLQSKHTNNLIRTLSAVNIARKQYTNKMQAWQVHSYGDLNELQLTSARIPHLSDPTDLLIKVNAASVNPLDTYMIQGYGKTIFDLFRGYKLEFPLTLGRDFSGTIIDKGHSVSNKFKIGDNVCGIIPLHKQGSHAETVVANEAYILHQPQHLSPTEVASILYASMTAWAALFITGELLFRDPRYAKVLILGASGGVGTMAVQLLKSQKATVMGTCSTDAVPLVTSLGANHVFDYTSPGYIENVAAEGKYDIILDCAKFGYQNIPKTWNYNRYITLNSPLLLNTDKYGLLGGLTTSVSELFGANVGRCPEGKSVRWGYFIPSTDGLKFVDKLISNQQIAPVIHKVFKFNELPEAYKAVTAGHLRGKIVVNMQDVV